MSSDGPDQCKLATGELVTPDALKDMTRYERTFNLTVEGLLAHIEHPEHRQLYIEAPPPPYPSV